MLMKLTPARVKASRKMLVKLTLGEKKKSTLMNLRRYFSINLN